MSDLNAAYSGAAVDVGGLCTSSSQPSYDDAQFRQLFAEFANVTTYPAATLQLFYGVAQDFITTSGSPGQMLNGNSLSYALFLLTAHLLALSLQQQNAPGGPGSIQGGVETGATIGEISVQRMTPPAENGWQFWLAQTPYGQQLWALLSLVSVGGTSVGGMNERNGFRKVGGVFW